MFIAGIGLAMSGQVKGQYLTIYGGPTYDSSTGSGYQFAYISPASMTPALYTLDNPDAGDGVGAAYSDDYVGGVDKGRRAIRWDSSGTAIELPNLGTDGNGNANSQVWAVNAAGVAVGSSISYVPGAQNIYPVRWDASGALTQLGGTYGEAFAVNSTGLAVGYSGTNAARWSASGTDVTVLDNLSSDYPAAGLAFAVNDSGTAVGYCNLGNEQGGRAVRWNASGTAVTELGNIGLDEHGGTEAMAYAINNAGTAVGFAQKEIPFESSLGPRAVRWDASGTVATLLDSFGPDVAYTGSSAYAINSAGVSVGIDANHAVRWAATGTAETLLAYINPDSTESAAYDINDSGIAVGYDIKFDPISQAYLGSKAVMWMPDGSVVDLNSLIDPASGWTLTNANAIDNNNWVSGVGTFDPDGPGPLPSYQRAFLIQVPEPTSMTMLAIGALMLRSRRRMN